MSTKYKFNDQDRLYFVSFAVINWTTCKLILGQDIVYYLSAGHECATFLGLGCTLAPDWGTPRFTFGPDFVGKGLLNGSWWDVTTTTPGIWENHMTKYVAFGDGNPIFYK